MQLLNIMKKTDHQNKLTEKDWNILNNYIDNPPNTKLIEVYKKYLEGVTEMKEPPIKVEFLFDNLTQIFYYSSITI